jgi:glycogen debranching enzyme
MTEATSVRGWEYRPDVFGGIEDISDTLVVREQGVFLLTDASGNVPADNGRGLGLYSRDTRHLSTYDFTLDGVTPVILLSTAESGFSLEQVMGNHRMVDDEGGQIGRCTIELSRQRVLSDGIEEEVRITNFNPFPVQIAPAYRFDADFADIFEIRGHERQRYGKLLTPEIGKGRITYRYLGVDGRLRLTRLAFDPEPDELTANGARFRLTVVPRQTIRLRLRVSIDGTRVEPGRETGSRRISQLYSRWQESFTRINTANEVLNRVLGRSITDLRMLWQEDEGGRRYIAAGTPWFDALFGRDSMITALQTLPFRPAIALDCLHMMARYQGQNRDPFRCEEPGKILHELRHDELCAIGELPYERYYGSVDSTPLFLLLAGEYFGWTNDVSAMRDLLPSILSALGWVRRYGDLNGDGFIDYATDSPTGLRNQGWKDSEDAICHADGSLCDGPISLPEVQGYLYAAYKRLPALLRALREDSEADRITRDAARLRRDFARTFWDSESEMLAMARDGQGRLAKVMSSNAGQTLWSGILSRQLATKVKDALMDNDMFTGWGIRTLSRSAVAYNPVGYHVGTIWPHDNAIVVAGLKRHGFHDEVNELATALFDAACAFQSYRLPEVFGGQPRSPHQPPVPYPVACRPQAWAAGAMLHVLQAVLGLAADASEGKLYLVRPKLPYWMGEVHLSGLEVGRGSVDLNFRRERGRTRVRVTEARDVEVVETSRWPY